MRGNNRTHRMRGYNRNHRGRSNKDKNLEIIQCNCRSIDTPGRQDELKETIDKNRPHLACLSETWRKPEMDKAKPIEFKGYNIIRKDRLQRRGGGIMFLIREDINFQHVKLNEIQNSPIEADAIEITLAHDRVRILNIYNPVTSINIDHLDHLINQLGRKYIVVGDFNGHHTLWDPEI